MKAFATRRAATAPPKAACSSNTTCRPLAAQTPKPSRWTTLGCNGLQLSYGKLKGVECGTPVIHGTTLSVTVSNAAALNRRTALTDRVYVCAYCPALGDAVCECVGTRAGGDFTLTVPASYADETVYVYAFVIGASSTNEGQASTTAYLGTARNGSSSGRNSGGSGTVNG